MANVEIDSSWKIYDYDAQTRSSLLENRYFR